MKKSTAALAATRLASLVAALLLPTAPSFAGVSISDMGTSGPNVAKITRKVEAAPPVNLSPAERDSIAKLVAKERSDTEVWLQTSPTSYLAAVARRDFGTKRMLAIGGDGSNDIQLVDSTIRARHLRVTVVGDSFRVETTDPAAWFVAAGDSSQRRVVGPSSIRVGRFTVRLSHQNYPAVIVFDPQSPHLSEYKGLRWFAYDPAYRFVAPLIVNPEPDTIEILSTHSDPREAIRVGWFVLSIDGKRTLLEATRLLEPGVGEDDLSVFFRDGTTGKESYAVGRYLEPERLGGGNYLLDFNNAYNPACAISPHYNCPIPPKFNKLKASIKAGEQDLHYSAGKKKKK